MHERTYDLAKQNRSKHACICVNVTNEFAFSREGEKELLRFVPWRGVPHVLLSSLAHEGRFRHFVPSTFVYFHFDFG
jgi:hypothetical protein